MMYGQEMRWNLPGRKRRILAFSDLHFCAPVAERRTRMILQRFRQICQSEHIDYIFFLGDLINSLEVLKDVSLRAQLEDFVRELAELAPLILVTGNHDMSYYGDGATRGLMRPDEWWQWARQLVRNPRIHVLDEALGEDRAVFDDGVMRVLGMNLPAVCYPTTVKDGRDSVEAFRDYARGILPKLTEVKGREHYLLLHNPQFLSKITIESSVAVLAGHMHNGLVPPILDELLRFSHHGIVGPGYYDCKGRKRSYVPLAEGARYRPQSGRLWLTLNSITHLPPESWLGRLDFLFPVMSYAIITGEDEKAKFKSRYFLELAGD